MLTVSVIDNATIPLRALPEDTRARLRAVIVRDVPQLASLVRAHGG